MATTNPNHIFWQDIAGVYDPVTGSYVFGDQSGNSLGSKALNLQSGRTNSANVASGARSSTVGYNSKASGNYSAAMGDNASATGDNSSAFGRSARASSISSTSIGYNAVASGDRSIAVGYNSQSSATLNGLAIGAGANASGVGGAMAVGPSATASAYYGLALGYSSNSRIDKTTNICGPIILQKDISQFDPFLSFSSARIILSTPEIDLTITASFTITIPTGAHFFPDEVGVVVTSANTVTVQPSMRFGNSGNHAALLAITAGSGLSAAQARNRFQTLVTGAGQQDLVAEVTTGATATTLLGRFYFTGQLIEDE